MGLLTRNSKKKESVTVASTLTLINNSKTMEDLSWVTAIVKGNRESFGTAETQRMAEMLYQKSYKLFNKLKKEGKLL